MAAYTPAMLEVRAYRRGDEAAINAGFNRVFGHQRSEAVWQWKFRQPAARGSTVVAFDGRDLAAHNGGIPARWQVDGVEVAALQGVDTFSLAAIERRREWKNAWLDVMTFFAEKIAREDGVELLFGFTGPRSEPHMVSRCGWDAEDPPRRIPLLTRTGGPPARTMASRWFVAQPTVGREVLLDRLWGRVRSRYPVSIVRDARFFSERFTEHPEVTYHPWIVRHRLWRTPAAAVVFRSDGGELRWADLVWDHRCPGALHLVDHLAGVLARQTGASSEALWLDGDPTADAWLRSRGFDGGPDPSGVVRVTRILSDRLGRESFAAGRIYTTMADADLV
jgi:hypothetical protein